MLVYLSWSGDRSRAVAKAIDGWLRTVIQDAIPWMSEDIDKGAAWFTTNEAKLRDADVGILCVTPENADSPWIHFEAGALWKALDTSRVCPYLLDMRPTDLSGPLAQLQVTTSDKHDTYKLVQTVNSALGKQARPDQLVKRMFDKMWPELETELGGIRPATTPSRPQREVREIAEETLEIVRELGRREVARSESRSRGLLGGAYRPLVPFDKLVPADMLIPAGQYAALAENPWTGEPLDPDDARVQVLKEVYGVDPTAPGEHEAHETPASDRGDEPDLKKDDGGED